QLNLDRNIDAAAQDVQSMIARAQRQLPPDMPTPPSLQKQNPADQAVVFLTLTTTTLPLSQLNEYAETVIAQRLSTVPGVGQVNLNGAQKVPLRIALTRASWPRARLASIRSRRRCSRRTPT